MPELPEVQHFKRYVDKTSLHQKIKSIKLNHPKQLVRTPVRLLTSTLKGNQFVDTYRHGKNLFILLKNNGYLMLHFGMTGDLEYFQTDEKLPHKFSLKISFHNGNHLIFFDPRQFGRIAFIKNLEEFIVQKGYGEDALKISEKKFVAVLSWRKIAVKTALLNQKIVAGIGNEFADEILFQSNIHPLSLTNKLSEKQFIVIYHHMKNILRQAVRVDADRNKLSQYFFLGNRRPGLHCPDCEGLTELKVIGGRSSYYCPSCQVFYR